MARPSPSESSGRNELVPGLCITNTWNQCDIVVFLSKCHGPSLLGFTAQYIAARLQFKGVVNPVAVVTCYFLQPDKPAQPVVVKALGDGPDVSDAACALVAWTQRRLPQHALLVECTIDCVTEQCTLVEVQEVVTLPEKLQSKLREIQATALEHGIQAPLLEWVVPEMQY